MEVDRAIDAYLRCAYEGPPPPRVAALTEALHHAPPAAFYACEAFERDGDARFALRLGNRHYPHMKLVIEQLPGRDVWLFRADAHDAHVLVDPADPDYPAYREMTARNRAIAAAIEAAWAAAGIDTFRAFLRRDLGARRA